MYRDAEEIEREKILLGCKTSSSGMFELRVVFQLQHYN